MKWSALRRAQRFGHSAGLSQSLFLLGFASALLIPLLLLDLGLIIQLQDQGAESRTWLSRLASQWVELIGQYQLGLLALVGAGGLLSILEAAMLLLLQRTAQTYALRVSTRLRSAIHTQAFRLGSHELLGVSRSRPEELFVDKTELVRQGLVLWWRAVPRSVIALGSLILLAVAVNAWLTLLALLLSAYIHRVYRGLRRGALASARGWRETAEQRRTKLLESLKLAPLTTGYSMEAPPGDSFAEELTRFHVAELRASSREALAAPLLMLIGLLAAGFLLLVVGLRDDVTVAGTVLLGAALICAYFPAARLYQLRRLADADEAAEEVFAYLDREPSVGQSDDAEPLERLTDEIKLDRVTLADRHGHRLLDNVTLTIPAGRRIAVIASDPQTPMALAGLFVRYYDPAAGRLLFDRHDICRATLDTVRGQALLVTANGPLFPGTVADNIACHDTGFTTHQISDAAKQARAHELIQSLPQGLSTAVGGDGIELRSHESFRIALARALLREPSLLVVQEPFGDVDAAAAHELEEALEDAARGRTLVVLPSLLSTLRSAEQIYLFHDGIVHAEGTHAELVQTNELYRHLNYVRFNEFRDKVKW